MEACLPRPIQLERRETGGTARVADSSSLGRCGMEAKPSVPSHTGESGAATDGSPDGCLSATAAAAALAVAQSPSAPLLSSSISWLGALVASIALFITMYFPQTAFEIIVFALIVGWISVFIRFLGVAGQKESAANQSRPRCRSRSGAILSLGTISRTPLTVA
jgi:hypothetical protein